MGFSEKLKAHAWQGHVSAHADKLRTHKKKTKEEVLELLQKGKIPNARHIFFTSKKYHQAFYERKHKGTYKRVECWYDDYFDCFYVRYYGKPTDESGRILWDKDVFDYKFVIDNK